MLAPLTLMPDAVARGVWVLAMALCLPLGAALLPVRRDVRWLVENEAHHFPFFGTLMSRLGAVRACPENAQVLLERGAVIAVFPEGNQGLRKTYRERHQELMAIMTNSGATPAERDEAYRACDEAYRAYRGNGG